MTSHVSHKLRLGIVPIALILFFWMNGYFFLELAGAAAPNVLLSIVIFLIAMAALVSVVIATRFWAILGMVFFGLNLLIATCFYRVTDHAMSLPEAQMLLNVADNVDDLAALSQFGSLIAGVVIALAGLMALMIWARTFVRVRMNTPLFVCTLAVVLSYGIRFLVPGAVALPANFTPSLDASALALHSLMELVSPSHERELALEKLTAHPTVRHIVLVIDESIEAEVFDSLLQRAQLDHARDLGIAYSYGNCSALSNMMLRRGFNPLDTERSSLRPASLFQLAKRSGFTTVFLDAQDQVNNRFFDRKEMAAVDMIPPIREFGPSRYDRDLVSVGIVTRILRNNPKAFVILNKMGTHFPYRDRLPPREANVPNPYQASVQRTSVGFLTRLVKELPPGTLVFYTSDHGQNFHAKMTHCNVPRYSVVSEWMVPLVVLYSEDLFTLVDGIDPRWQNRTSHAALAETLRNLMGYRLSGAESLLTPPLQENYHRAFYGPPALPFFYGYPFLIIDKSVDRADGSFHSRN